jgi:tripartite-type tricarboxylate transporter receptor subunit TctC
VQRVGAGGERRNHHASAVAQRLNRECNEALASREVRQRLAALGIEPIGGTSRQFDDLIASETMRWGA